MNLNVIALYTKYTYSRVILLSILYLSLVICLHAQTNKPVNVNVDPKTLNAAGGNYSFISSNINWSFGEVFSTTLSNSDKLILTTDFLQSNNSDIILIPPNDTLYADDSIQFSIKAFPNPATSTIFLSIDQSRLKLLTIELYNSIGNKLYSVDEILNNSLLYNKAIPLTSYTVGTYLLVVKYVFNKNHYRTKVFKIVKV